MKRWLIECGAREATVADASDYTDAIALNVSDPGKNVNLRIDYISRPMLGNMPDLLIDLLEVAAYVYCADQRCSRGSDKLTDYGANWRRSLSFSIPVRRPEVWQDPDVKDALARTLGFLSDDSYEFEFRKAEVPLQPRELYFPELIDAFQENDEVALFSGGVDSFAGTINDVVTLGKSVTLVGHCSSPKVRNVQQGLIDGLKGRGFDRRVSYIPVWVSNENIRPAEFTQRTRSFLFACLGLVVARMSGKTAFSFYENGVVSINPPLAGDVIGGRATRTTHPKVLRGLENLFSTLLECQIEIRTPLQWLTKKEVTQKIADAGFADMIASTVSCTRTRDMTVKQKHCGLCSQCIDRRFAILAAGLGEYEASESYRCDLLLGDRSTDDDLRMALSYVRFAQRISAMSKDRFPGDLTEVISALDNFTDLSVDQAGSRVFEMLQRHAKSVEEVITQAVKEHGDRLYRGEVFSGSLLAACVSRDHVEIAPPSNYNAEADAFMDQLTAPILEFAFDDVDKRVLFHGGHHLDGANYRFVKALIDDFRSAKKIRSEIPFASSYHVAKRMNLTDQSMRQQLSRLRKALDPLAVMLGIPLDQNSLVETNDRAGYRLNPSCREISVGDIRDSDTQTSPL